jgi:hypothetical protein
MTGDVLLPMTIPDPHRPGTLGRFSVGDEHGRSAIELDDLPRRVVVTAHGAVSDGRRARDHVATNASKTS